jgi:hypothetical protein
MRLRLRDLRRIAESSMRGDFDESLRNEIVRVFGPIVNVPGRVEKVAEAAIDHYDYLVHAKKRVPSGFSQRLAEGAARSESVRLRRLAARVMSEDRVHALLDDDDPYVRIAAARRASLRYLSEAARRHKGDDELTTIARRRIAEASRTEEESEVPDSWYELTAADICREYGRNLERNWEETAAAKYAMAYHASSGVRVDVGKLLAAILDRIEARDDEVMKEGRLGSLARLLEERSRLSESEIPDFVEEVDPLAEVFDAQGSSAIVAAGDAVFRVRKSSVPAAIRKHRLGEGNARETQVPAVGTIPGEVFTSRIEKALDRYVEAWNARQSTAGEPLRLSWNVGTSPGRISFSCVLS